MSSKNYPDAVVVSVVIRLVAAIHGAAYVLCSSSPCYCLSLTIPLGIFAITPFTGRGTENQRSLLALSPNTHRK